MELNFKSKMELDDYIKFCKFANRKNRRISLIIVWVCLIIIFRESNIPTIIFGYVFCTVLYMLMGKFGTEINAKKAYNSDKLMQKECEYTVNENGIIEKTSMGELKIEFSDVLKVEEDRDSIYVFVGKIRAWVIPKRNLSKEEQEKLKEIIKTNIGQK